MRVGLSAAAAIGATVVALMVSGCGATADQSGPVAEASIAANLTSQTICDGALTALTDAALPDSTLTAEAEEGSIGCMATEGVEVTRISVNYELTTVDDMLEIFESLADGSEQSLEQCPGGASMPTIDAGFASSVALLCVQDEKTVFEFHGAGPSGRVVVRADRAIAAGEITADEAQEWTRVAVAALSTGVEEGSEAGSDHSTAEPTLATPVDAFDHCAIVFEAAGVEEWRSRNGLPPGVDTLNPTWSPTAPNGPTLSCGQNGVLYIVIDATDEATAERILSESQALDALFPDVESSAALDGATGSSSYLSSGTSILASVDLRRDLRLVYVQLTVSDSQVDESTANQILLSIAGVAFDLELPPPDSTWD